ncbi:hypothetical protein RD792_005205 [Penstemon davidsonii]|uniref:F-box domain-containing protein n=1 Tax=Penstemon davidsonii TaxID=160366 RepID=A0ABR0DKF4_9LAMI|nr:hypothetical protein RD792_005205 [Penstemon davidsonii]
MQTKSAEIVGSNEDLLTEILLRLPVKSLIDFKLVSKQWHSIITNPNFCHLRSCRKTKPPAIGLFIHSGDFSYNESFDYVPFSVPRLRISPIQKHRLTIEDFSLDIRVVQSCNGLLLCRNIKGPGEWKYYVCNPTTKHSFRIPQLDENIKRGMCLAFDPAKSPHYHVVCVHECPKNSDLSFRIQIYSSKTGSWKICGNPFSSPQIYGRAVYWNGSVHWISILSAVFMYFNIDRQVLDKMPLPRISLRPRTKRFIYYFGESCDHLHFIIACQYEIRFDVYEMKRDYSEWFVKYKVDLSRVVAAYPEMIRDYNNRKYYHFHVLSLVRGEEEEEEPFLVLHIPRKVVRYNLVSMTFRVLHDFVSDESNYIMCYGGVLNSLSIGFQYIESLSCV